MEWSNVLVERELCGDGDTGSGSQSYSITSSRTVPVSMDGNTLLSLDDEVQSESRSAPEHNSDDSPSSSDNGDFKKGIASRTNRDPMSHRIIEKRRRDRMNNCLTNLSKLIPSAYLKKGRGRIEKTEIIEMAIRYMKHMQSERRQLAPTPAPAVSQEFMKDKAIETDESAQLLQQSSMTVNNLKLPAEVMSERYKQGFYDCIAETLRFLALSEGLVINELSKTRLLIHLKDYFSRITYDTLTPNISELLHPPSVTATSVLSLPWTPLQKGIGQFSYESSSSSSPSSSPKKDDNQPLNMSLKRTRVEKPCGSQLREILTDAKDASQLSNGQSNESSSVKRPHVFRYTSGLSLSSAGDIQINRPSLQHAAPSNLLLSANGPLPFPAHHNPCNSSASSGSTIYPSSPGSSQSFSGGSFAGDSPPRVVSPPSALPAAQSQHQMPLASPVAGVPIFALHPSGTYYIPMTLNPANLEPAVLQKLTSGGSTPPATCHPVTITVNFCPGPNANSSATTLPSYGVSGPIDSRHLITAREGVILAAASSTNVA